MATQKKKPNTYTLLEPISHDGKLITEITLRRMKVKDTFASEDEVDDAKSTFHTMAAMSGQPIEVIGEMCMEDFEELQEMMVPLMGKSAVAAYKAMKESPPPPAKETDPS